MTDTARLALLLALGTWACSSPDPLPTATVARQLDLAGRIIMDLGKLPKGDVGAAEDGARAVAEVAVAGYAPRLRLLAAEDDAALARGAARALVQIRLLRAPDRVPTLAECVRTETNAFVRDECRRESAGPIADPPSAPAVRWALLDDRDAERRRSVLREWLDSRSKERVALDGPQAERLVHRLEDGDLRVRLLTQAVFLRAALAPSR